MLRRTSRKAFSKQLTMGIAVGLSRDHEPHWPLPLPPPLSMTPAALSASAPPVTPATPDTGAPGLPPKKHTLVLDIDETLLHTLHQEPHPSTKHLDHYHVLLRPHVDTFLQEVNSLFEVVLWTAGVATYGGAVTNLLERTAGFTPSSIYDAERLWSDMRKDAAATKTRVEEEDHVNWYLLSRKQTLERLNWMKYIPMLGRDEKSVVMIDDNVRSFPLTPRSGIKIAPFDPRGYALEAYFNVLQELRIEPERFPHVSRVGEKGNFEAAEASEDPNSSIARKVDYYAQHLTRGDRVKAHAIAAGMQEIQRLENDRALLDVLPLLRSVAAAPDVRLELDHWRHDEYTRCDNFMESMRSDTVERNGLLGVVLPQRRANGPIPAFRPTPHNYPFMQEAKQHMHELWRQFKQADKPVEKLARSGGRSPTFAGTPRSNL